MITDQDSGPGPGPGPKYQEYQKYYDIPGYSDDTRFMYLKQYDDEHLESFMNKLQNNENFTIVRYNDGEYFNMMSSYNGRKTCDNCIYFKDQGLELIEAYVYFLGQKDTFITKWHTQVYNMELQLDEDYKELYKDQLFEQKFLSNGILTHKLPFNKKLIEFFKTIKNSTRPKMYMTNKLMLNTVKPILGIHHSVELPDKDSYLIKDHLLNNENVNNILSTNSNMIILFSAGMFSKIAIRNLHEKYPNHTYIDIGSTFDGLVKVTRDFNYEQSYIMELHCAYMEQQNTFDVPLYICHYHKLTDRREYLEKELLRYNFNSIYWFDYIDRDTMTQEQLDLYEYNYDKWYQQNAQWYHFESRPRKLSGAEIANLHTHLDVYKHIIANGIPYALIMEDDVIFNELTGKKLKRILDGLSTTGFDICYLYNVFGTNLDFSHYSLHKINISSCTVMYLVSLEGARKLLEQITHCGSVCLPIDWVHNVAINNENNVPFNVYISDSIVSQGSETVYASKADRPSINNQYSVSYASGPIQLYIDRKNDSNLNEFNLRMIAYDNYTVITIRDYSLIESGLYEQVLPLENVYFIFDCTDAIKRDYLKIIYDNDQYHKINISRKFIRPFNLEKVEHRQILSEPDVTKPDSIIFMNDIKRLIECMSLYPNNIYISEPCNIRVI
jgi:GR25 family glycosyltransferase involved in LPS biosynthesis